MSRAARYGHAARRRRHRRASPTSRWARRSSEVLDAHLAASPRFRGIRHASGWDASDEVRNSHTNPPPAPAAATRSSARASRELARYGLVVRRVAVPSAARRPGRPGARVSRTPRSSSTTSAVRSGSVPTRGGAPRSSPTGSAASASSPPAPTWWSSSAASRCRSTASAGTSASAPPTSEQLAASQRPVPQTCIELFGPERCMFESNFPVDRVSCSYSTLWNAFKRVAERRLGQPRRPRSSTTPRPASTGSSARKVVTSTSASKAPLALGGGGRAQAAPQLGVEVLRRLVAEPRDHELEARHHVDLATEIALRHH